jgi:hypothetical protein
MRQRNVPDEPRAEPEIIPPGDPRARRADARTRFESTERIYVGRIGPFGLALALLAITAVAGLGLLLLLGAFVILVPLAGLLVAIVLAANLFRRWLR